jgi:hypothetical protein
MWMKDLTENVLSRYHICSEDCNKGIETRVLYLSVLTTRVNVTEEERQACSVLGQSCVAVFGDTVIWTQCFMLAGRCSIIWAALPDIYALVYFLGRVSGFLPWTQLQMWSSYLQSPARLGPMCHSNDYIYKFIHSYNKS